MRDGMQADKRLLRQQPIVVEPLAGSIENIKIVVEDIGIKHDHRIAGEPIPRTARDMGTRYLDPGR